MHTYTPRNILITGGAGFIGCHLVRHLLRTDAQVRIVNLDLLTYAGSLDNLDALPDPERHEVVQGTICDRQLVEKLLREHDIDTIVHCAAESHVDRSISGPAAFIETNIVGTFALLEAARDVWLREDARDTHQCRFQHISTDEVYGALTAHEPAFSETTPFAPNSPYAASKAASDHLVRAYRNTYGLPAIITHCSNNYGPHQHPEKFIPTVIRSCLQGQAIPVYGDGSNRRDWLYVEDHCAAIDLILRRGRTGETYNIGGDNNWPNLDVVHLICKVLADLTGRSAQAFTRLIHFVTDRPGHDWRYAIDATKLRHELGWTPTETFEMGMRKTVAWYLEQYPQGPLAKTCANDVREQKRPSA